jgi:hypothetical protein
MRKNSVLLKEVLMKRWQRRACVVADEHKRDAVRDASSACEIYVGKCQD